METSHRVYRAGFCDLAFEVTCNNDDAYCIAEFLFMDFPGIWGTLSTRQYDIVSSGPNPTLSLWAGDKRLYFGTSRYQLAYTLMNEVIFQCINTNDSQHALHAGAVFKDDRCIILPGQSGSGKSTLTGWLIKNGFNYLSDELIFLEKSGKVIPLTRPLSVKVNATHKSWLLKEKSTDIIYSENGSMIPHRLLNDTFTPQQPSLTHIVFPHYVEGAAVTLQPLSPAKSCLMLMQSHVNARNHDGLGVPQLAETLKNCSSYSLTYSRFEDLESIFFSPDLLS